MFKIFFFIVFFAVLLFLLAGFSIIRTNATHAKRHTASSSRRSDQASASRTPTRKKVIAEDEGEYVDYEEIK